jgi:hypothetical protein
VDQTPGNAALVYLRAESPEWWHGLLREPNVMQKVEAARKAPLKDLPTKGFAWLIQSKQLRELDLAARKDHCDWQMNDRIKSENIRLLLPEVQSFRNLAMLLALRARLEIAEGRFDQAVYSLQTGLALARHLNEYPLLICSLVSVAIAQEMIDQLETLLEQPHAPNLYWALADLPARFLDLRLGFQGETLVLTGLLPSRQELEAGPLTPAQAVKLMAPFLQVWGDEFHPKGGSAWERQVVVCCQAAKFYPEAKRLLLQEGWPAARVEAMPALQVVMLYSLARYERYRDDLFKWFNFPFWQARPGMALAMDQLARARRDFDEGFPFGSLLLPAVGQVNVASVRVDRRLVALRCIEAIRLHAAIHDGKPPEQLDEITIVPVPADPATGQPFGYKVTGQRITLSAPVPPGEPPISANSFRYELTFTP